MADRLVPPTSRRLLLGSGALLTLAGAATTIAAWIRWLPCRPGADVVVDGVSACALAQNHLRDYLVPSEPFAAVPGAVWWAAVSTVLLTVFWAVWGRSLARRRRLVAAASAASCAAGHAVVAASQLLAAGSDGALGVLPAMHQFGPLPLILSAVPFVAAVIIAFAADARARAPWIIMSLALVPGHALVDYFVLLPYSQSADTPTGSGYPGGAALVLAGLVFVSAAAAARRATTMPVAAPPRAGLGALPDDETASRRWKYGETTAPRGIAD